MTPPFASPLPAGATPLGMPGSWCTSACASDVDALAEAQPDWRLEYEQLSAGPFSAELQHIQLPGMRLVLERASRALRQRGELGQGAFGFAMSLQPGAPVFFSGQRAGHQAMMVGRSDALDLCTPDDHGHIGVVVDQALLAPLWERMYQKPLSVWLQSQLVAAVKPAAGDALRALQLDAMAQLQSAARQGQGGAALLQLRDALLMEWIATLPEAVDTSDLPAAAARKRIVDRASALMLGAPDAPLSMLAVCQQIGVSRRKLNYCFQDVLGTSPVKYLRAVRLQGVRRELRQGRGPVQDAAARWGFWHLGQFALDYKRQFAELPSATLKGVCNTSMPRAGN